MMQNSDSIQQLNNSNQQEMLKNMNKVDESLKDQITNLEKIVMEYIGYDDKYEIKDIPIHDAYSFESETIHSVVIKSHVQSQRYLYLGHGFGGTSLMYFAGMKSLLEKVNLVLWEIRGMGLNQKPQRYQVADQQQIIKFFMNGLRVVIDFYQHQNIVLVSHSFSAYITMRFILQEMNNQKYRKRIKKLILLSPVGITAKQNDYKNSIHSCGDIKHVIISKIGWKFNLTYKSPMRTICACMKHSLIKGAFKKYGLTQQQLNILTQMFLLMVDLQDGSQNLFFDCFQPRVLPKNGQSIEQICETFQLGSYKLPTKMIFGQNDWADKTGAKFLSTKSSYFEVQSISSCDHMLPLYKQQIKKIVENL